MSRLIFTLYAISTSAVVAAAQDKEIRQLADKSYRIRQEATAALFRMGPRALPAIRKGAASDNLEVRARCHELLEVHSKLAELEARHGRGVMTRADYVRQRVTLTRPFLRPAEILALLTREVEREIERAVTLRKAGFSNAPSVEARRFELLDARYRYGLVTPAEYHAARVARFKARLARADALHRGGALTTDALQTAKLVYLLERRDAGELMGEQYRAQSRPLVEALRRGLDDRLRWGQLSARQHAAQVAAIERYEPK